MANGVEIRRCTINDVELIEKLERESFRPDEQYTLDFIKWLLRWCHPYSFLAYANGEPVGYVISCRESPDVGHVISIGVKPGFRGRGIGKELLKASLCSLINAGVRHVYLEVRVSNEVAIRLYKRLGFKIQNVLPCYYANGEDAYVMVLDEVEVERLRELCLRVFASRPDRDPQLDPRHPQAQRLIAEGYPEFPL